MTKPAAQLDAEIAEVLRARARRWEPPRYTRARDLVVGDVLLSGNVPPYTAHEVTQIEEAPRRRLRLILTRLPDRDYQHASLLRPTDTVAVPASASSVFHGTSRGRPRDKSTRKRISDAVRAAIEAGATEIIEGAYRRHATVGGKEPCVTVGLVADYLRQAHMPEDFRWAPKERQRTWTRSVLESMRRRGQVGSSLGAGGRCYEPKR